MQKNQQGFTIMELMIATLVFSVILMSITVGVMFFTKSYYRGVYLSATQDTARNIAEQITQSIQFTSSDPIFQVDGIGGGYICTGNSQFVFNKGQKYDGQPATTGMYVIPLTSNACNSDPSLSDPGSRKQLLGKNMRLADLSFSKSGNRYTVKITIAYGNNDLLCVSGDAAMCDTNSTPSDANLMSHTIVCKPGSGSEYCAVSSLETVVEKRLQ